MKTIKLFFTLLCIPALLWAQLPYQQSFETTSGYTTSVPFASSGSDYFGRFNNANPGNWTTAPITGYDGVWYIGAEDIDGINDPNPGPTEITVTTDGINISGSTNLEVSIKVGASGDNGSNNRYESGDYLLVEYQLNGSGGWTTVGVFGGGAGGSASYFYHDVLRNGITGTGDDVQMTKDMSNITYNINSIAGSPISGSTMMVRVRFSVAGPQEEVQFDDIRVTGTAASCSITDLTAGTAAPCTNNLYNRDVTVTYANAPASGTLDVYGQSFAITGSPQTVTLIALPADGASVDVTASFSAAAACTYTETGLFTNLEPCVVCSISTITAGAQLPCSIGSNKYAQEVIVAYSTPPSAGNLNVNGQLFPITGSPQTCLLANLAVGGGAVNVSAFFTDLPGCTKSENTVFVAPTTCPCTINAPANLLTESFEGTSGIGYTTSIPFFTALPDHFNVGEDADFTWDGGTPPNGEDGTKYVSIEDVTGIQSLTLDAVSIAGHKNFKIKIKMAAPSQTFRYDNGDVVDIQYRLDGVGNWNTVGHLGGLNSLIGGTVLYLDAALNGVTGTGDDIAMGATMYDATFDIDQVIGYGVQGNSLEIRVLFSLQFPYGEFVFDHVRLDATKCDPVCSITDVTAGTQSPCVNSTYSQEVTVEYIDAPATGTLDVNGQSFAITSSPQTVTLTNLTADGNPVNVTAQFSDNTGCNFTAPSLFTAPTACLPAPTCTGTSLATGAAANTNVFSIAWDVNSKCNPVTIKDIQATTIPSGATVNILTRAGTYVGHEDLITGWTIVGAFVAGTNSYLTGGTMNVQIPANSTQAFALALDQASFLGGAGVACEVNPAAPAIVASNVDLEYTKGIYTTSPLIPTSPNAIFAGAMCYDVTPTPPFNLAFNMYDLNYPFANGATDPNTFYYGVTWAKRLRVLVSGGVGPFTYLWSNSQGYNTIAAHVPNQRYLQTPAGPSDMICEVTDLGTGCTQTGFITVGWSDEYFCGTSHPNMYQMIKMCQGGINVCMNGQQAKAALLAGTASLGECPTTPKREDANEDSFIVYPNPTTGFTTMHYNASENTTATALIIDLNGRIISSDEIYLSRGITEYGFDLSGLTNGMYFVQLRTQNSVETQKIQVLK